MEHRGWGYSENDARRVVVALVGVELALIAAFLFTQIVVPSWGQLGNLFDVGLDLSLPAWFSTLQLFLVGAVLLLGAASNHPDSSIPTWLLVVGALGFVFLSADEGAGIHERITDVVADADLTFLLFDGGHGGWVALYAVAGVAVVVGMRRWLVLLWTERRRESLIGALGVGIYLTGAGALEVLGYETEAGGRSWVDNLRIAVEELMEMTAVSVLLYAALLLTLSVANPSPVAEPRS